MSEILESISKNKFISGLILWAMIYIVSIIIQQVCYFTLSKENEFISLVHFLPTIGFLVGLTMFLANLGLISRDSFPWL